MEVFVMTFIKKAYDDTIRRKIDGFTLESNNGSEMYSFKTIDTGVYYPPDEKANIENKSKEEQTK
jgi:hypothetical protein